ncbi:polymerase/histidinol phosphatase-like protein [Neohortaea acidophila]|uniref:Histidinol-phosphatase n=1 Tax=Neohortaea acidophila TaxID=245834 RepID=A0A6A6PKY1_9PEZI|nr:polymerase/histidinol phosphatase-like protein [Neohortaea acidophila]KAF2480672.1 polymerase/histidinol phosphatase-like protein [Neohortaea acidophila]
MPFSHHSHSGQFCGHATNTLDEVVQAAINKGMTTFCLTEHIPRERIDFYPREEEEHTPETLYKLFDDYYREARRLQAVYKDQIVLFIGFEGEWIRPSSLTIIHDLLSRYEVDLFLGSVHHVHTIPIDYDPPVYHRARDVGNATDERIFQDYFDAQLAMLEALHPPIVAHFDLIRLFSDQPNQTWKTWPSVWAKLLRNLRFIADYGGVLELNSSSLRKGMTEAYPQVEVCQEFKALGGRFTLSDDSHGVPHVGLNYDKVLDCVKRAGIADVCHLAPVSDTVKPHDSRFPNVGWQTVSVADLEKHPFWAN